MCSNKENLLNILNKDNKIEKMDSNVADFEFKFSSRPTLEGLGTELLEFCKERNWQQYHTPRNLLLALVGEVGELSEIFQWKGEVPVGLGSSFTDKEREHLEQELSDVFIYLIRLAQSCKIDLPKAVEAKIELNKAKYPVEKCFGKSKKYHEYN